MYNGHADVTALLKTDGTIMAAYRYDAFGNALDDTTKANLKNIENPYTYAGYRFDDESGLYYLNARYYDPATARFMSEDTYSGDPSDPLSLNLYTYCSNNPIVYTDPTGHWQQGDGNLSPAAQLQILQATKEYLDAKAKGNTDAMETAHQKAVDARYGVVYYSNTNVTSSQIESLVNSSINNSSVSKSIKQDIKDSSIYLAAGHISNGTPTSVVNQYVNMINTERKDSNFIDPKDIKKGAYDPYASVKNQGIIDVKKQINPLLGTYGYSEFMNGGYFILEGSYDLLPKICTIS